MFDRIFFYTYFFLQGKIFHLLSFRFFFAFFCSSLQITFIHQNRSLLSNLEIKKEKKEISFFLHWCKKTNPHSIQFSRQIIRQKYPIDRQCMDWLFSNDISLVINVIIIIIIVLVWFFPLYFTNSRNIQCNRFIIYGTNLKSRSWISILI